MRFRIDHESGAWLERNEYGAWARTTAGWAINSARDKYAAVDKTQQLLEEMYERIRALNRLDEHTDEERAELARLDERTTRLEDEFAEWHADLLTGDRINWRLWLHAGGDLDQQESAARMFGDDGLIERIRAYRKRHNLDAVW